MTKPPSESPAEQATQAKRNFVVAAHAASPMRAVERYPWTAVTATAAATMAATVVVSLPVFGKSSGKVGGTLISTGMALAGSLLRAKFMPPGVDLNATLKPTPRPSDSKVNVDSAGTF